MKLQVIWSGVSAGATQTSASIQIDCGQDMRYLIQLTKTGADGDPSLYIEESLDDVVWTTIPNYEATTEFFPIDEDIIAVRDSYFMGKYIRLRSEPNGTTTGTLSAKIGIKTKSN
jgi:hypothetical protein